jgi:heptaprenyl diphosphate synthase
VSLSILAAFAHMIGQLILVRLWLIPHAGLAYLVPLFMAAALLFGLINGIVTSHLLATYPKPAD